MEVVNGLGALFLNEDSRIEFFSNPITEYTWNPDGKGFTTTCRSLPGEPGTRWKTVGMVRDQLPDPGPGKTAAAPEEEAEVTREKWTEDANGFIKTIRYFDAKNQPQKDP